MRSGVRKAARASPTTVFQPGTGQGAEDVGQVDGAVDQEDGRRAIHLGEHRPVFELEQPIALLTQELGRCSAQLFGPVRLPGRATVDASVPDDPFRSEIGAGHDGVDDGRRFAARRGELLGIERRVSRSGASRSDPVGSLGAAFRPGLERKPFDEDVDLAAAWEADRPGQIVGDAVREQTRRALVQHLACLHGDVALDAAARDGAGELATLRDGELGAERPRCRAARGHDGRDGDGLVAPVAPALDVAGDVLHASRLVSCRCRSPPRWTPAAGSLRA